jgi:hypothetical protein
VWRTGAKGKNKGLNLATQRGRRGNGGTGEKSMDEKSEIRAAKNEKWRSNRGVSQIDIEAKVYEAYHALFKSYLPFCRFRKH